MLLLHSEGVEEKKEDDDDSVAAIARKSFEIEERVSKANEIYEQEHEYDFEEQLQRSISDLFGLFGAAIEAVIVLAEGEACCCADEIGVGSRVKYGHETPPLSIVEALRKTTRKRENRAMDIPMFLGEDSVRSIDDDNISAISQETLEEMEKRNGHCMQEVMQSKKKQDQKVTPGGETEPRTARRSSMGFTGKFWRLKKARKKVSDNL